MEVVASLSQGRTAAAQCGFLHTNQSRSYLNHLVHIRQLYETKHRLFAKNVRLGTFLSLKLQASLQTSYPEFQVASRSVKQEEECTEAFFSVFEPFRNT